MADICDGSATTDWPPYWCATDGSYPNHCVTPVDRISDEISKEIHCVRLDHQPVFQVATNVIMIGIMTNNPWERIPNGMFCFLEQLTSLNLSHNTIRELNNGSFNCLERLKKLDLSYNRLTILDNQTFHALANHSLEWLSVANNIIIRISGDALVDLNGLKKIYLSDNKIKNLSETTFGYKRFLEELWLNDNGLTGIAYRTFENLTRLSVAHLENNYIRGLAAGTFYYANMANYFGTLDLANNSLRGVQPNAFYPRASVSCLDISGNPLLSCASIDNLPKATNTFGVREECKGGMGRPTCANISCPENAICHLLTPGRPRCYCKRGYIDNNNNCSTDIDECQESPCETGALCTNTHGSYTCTRRKQPGPSTTAKANTTLLTLLIQNAFEVLASVGIIVLLCSFVVYRYVYVKRLKQIRQDGEGEQDKNEDKTEARAASKRQKAKKGSKSASRGQSTPRRTTTRKRPVSKRKIASSRRKLTA